MTFEEAEKIIGQMMAVQRELQEGQLRLLSAQDRDREHSQRQIEQLSESTARLNESTARLNESMTTLNNAMLRLIDIVQNHEQRIRTLESDNQFNAN